MITRFLTRNTQQSIVSYFFKMFVIAFVPTLLLAVVVGIFFNELTQKTVLNRDSVMGAAGQFLMLVVLVPLIESLLLIYLTFTASSALRNQSLAALSGAIPIAALHVIDSWQKVFVIAWFFVVQAYVYLELKKHGMPFKNIFIFITLFHGLHNSFAYIALVGNF